MKHILALALLCLLPATALAWDGFDADTTALVEVTPAEMPKAGQTIEIRDYDTDETNGYTVESVKRNVRTVEISVRNTATNSKRVVVMEGL